jgi:hypothetical protein
VNGDRIGGYGGPRSGRATLPFNLTKPDEQKIIVHFKILDPDPEVRQKVAQELTRAVKDIHIGDYGLYAVISGENVEVTTADAAVLAKQVVPFVLKALGMERFGLGDKENES